MRKSLLKFSSNKNPLVFIKKVQERTDTKKAKIIAIPPILTIALLCCFLIFVLSINLNLVPILLINGTTKITPDILKIYEINNEQFV